MSQHTHIRHQKQIQRPWTDDMINWMNDDATVQGSIGHDKYKINIKYMHTIGYWRIDIELVKAREWNRSIDFWNITLLYKYTSFQGLIKEKKNSKNSVAECQCDSDESTTHRLRIDHCSPFTLENKIYKKIIMQELDAASSTFSSAASLASSSHLYYTGTLCTRRVMSWIITLLQVHRIGWKRVVGRQNISEMRWMFCSHRLSNKYTIC